jgi:hypothetical protein
MTSILPTTSASDAVRQILGAMKLDRSTMELVQRKCVEAKVPFTAEWIRNEWRNEVLANRHNEEVVSKACETPAVAFLQFANEAIANPMRPAPRVVRSLMERYGLPFVAMMHQTRWPRELSWVDRYRNHPDDIVALLAHAFLQLIQPEQIELPKSERDPSRRGVSHVFSRLVEHAHKTAFSITDIEKDPYFDYSEADIIGAPLPEDWFPLAINFMEASLGAKLRLKNPQALAAQAERIREQYRTEKRNDSIKALVEQLVRDPLPRKVMILKYTMNFGFSASQVQAIYEQFVGDIRAMRITTDHNKVESEFMNVMAQAKGNPPTIRLSPSRAKEIRAELGQIRKSWFSDLDPILREAYEGDRMDIFSKWRDLIEGGVRPLPSDLVIDYGLFLIERKQKG